MILSELLRIITDRRRDPSRRPYDRLHSHLAGWIAFDTGRHGLAQRHFIQALRLAHAAGDVGLGCYVLANRRTR